MAGRSTCPECGTILRIRDRTFVGRKVHCPECKVVLCIEATDQDEQYAVRRLTPEELASADKKKQSRPAAAAGTAKARASQPFFSRVVSSPLTATWLVLFAIVSLFAVLAFNPRVRFSSNQQAVPNEIEAPEAVTTPSEPATPEVADVPEAPEPVQSAPIVEPDVEAISALEPANTLEPLTWSPVVETKEDAEPVEPPPPTPPKVDVVAKMAQPIHIYKQPKISRRVLIDALQEQLGASIRYNVEELGSRELDDKVSFELEDTTLGEVLNKVSDSAGWQVVVEETGIRLTRKESPAKF